MASDVGLTESAPRLNGDRELPEGWGSDLERADAIRRPKEETRLTRRGRLLAGWREWVVTAMRVAIVIAAGFGLFEFVVAGVIHDARQKHLGADFAAPAARVRVGDALAVIQIPKIGVNEVVSEGDGPGQLRAGPGHRALTPRFGRPGSAVVVGYRTRYTGPFARLKDLTAGDQIVVQMRNEESAILYQVTGSERVSQMPDQAPLAGADSQLALVTATSGFFKGQYLVVIAKPVATQPPASGAVPPAKATQPESTQAAAPAIGGTAFRGGPAWLIPLWVALVIGAVAIARRLRARYDVIAVMAVGIPVVVFSLMQLFLALDSVITYPL